MNEETPLMAPSSSSVASSNSTRKQGLLLPFFAAMFGAFVGATAATHWAAATTNDKQHTAHDLPMLLGRHNHQTMKRIPINPVSWGETYHLNQGEIIQGTTKTLYTSGQVGVEEDGVTFLSTDLGDQLTKILSSMDAILQQAGMDRSNIINIHTYVTDMEAMMKHIDIFTEWIGQAGIMPTHTLIGVASLFEPECKIEMEIIAAA